MNLVSSERSGVARAEGIAKKTDRVWLGGQRELARPPGRQK